MYQHLPTLITFGLLIELKKTVGSHQLNIAATLVQQNHVLIKTIKQATQCNHIKRKHQLNFILNLVDKSSTHKPTYTLTKFHHQ